MKSKINYKDNSICLSFSLRTWVYILFLLRTELKRVHSDSFKRLFSFEFSELKELVDFEPPFGFSYDARASLTVEDIDISDII